MRGLCIAYCCFIRRWSLSRYSLLHQILSNAKCWMSDIVKDWLLLHANCQIISNVGSRMSVAVKSWLLLHVLSRLMPNTTVAKWSGTSFTCSRSQVQSPIFSLKNAPWYLWKTSTRDSSKTLLAGVDRSGLDESIIWHQLYLTGTTCPVARYCQIWTCHCNASCQVSSTVVKTSHSAS